MAEKELLPKVELLNLDDELSEEESLLPICRQPDHRRMTMEPKRPEVSCMHEKLTSCEFSCRRKHFDRRKGDSSKDFPTLDPSLETAQVTTIARKLEERKVMGKSKKKARREKKKAEKKKQGVAKKEPGDSSNSKVHPAAREASSQCSHHHDELDVEISQEEIEALIKRLRVVPKDLPNLREDRYLTVPEYDEIFKISYCGHQKACGDYRLQHVNKNSVPFLERVAAVQDFLEQYLPFMQHVCQTTNDNNCDDNEDEVFVSTAPMDKIFISSFGVRNAHLLDSPTESDEECEPEEEEDRYLRFQRSQIVELLEKVHEDILDLGKMQKMKEIEMLKQMGLTAEWLD